MNDRYLYRAKRTDNGEWVVGSYVYTFAPDKKCHVVGVMTENYWIVEENGNMVLVDKYTICQCTGLKDKNDKDIYEGDILRKSGYWDVRVEFERGQFCIKGADIVQYLNKTIDESIRNFPVDEYEVIGNIFDNQELLEK